MILASKAYLNKIAPLTAVSSVNGVKLRSQCSQCDARDEWNVRSMPPPDQVTKHFAERGWSIKSANRILCPQCSAKRKEKPVTKLAAVPTPAFDAKAARREAHDLIAMTFSIPTGQYSDGYSDERIAKETGISLDWVKQRREEEFGSLKQPDELAQMRKELADAAEAVAEIKARFEKLCTNKGWAA